jgi:hypothetical protein
MNLQQYAQQSRGGMRYDTGPLPSQDLMPGLMPSSRRNPGLAPPPMMQPPMGGGYQFGLPNGGGRQPWHQPRQGYRQPQMTIGGWPQPPQMPPMGGGYQFPQQQPQGGGMSIGGWGPGQMAGMFPGGTYARRGGLPFRRLSNQVGMDNQQFAY